MTRPTPRQRSLWHAERTALECQAVMDGAVMYVRLLADGHAPELARATVEALVHAERTAILAQPPPWHREER